MGVLILVAVPVIFIGLLAGLLFYTLREGERERNK